MRKYLQWGRLEVWTSLTVPPDADAFEFGRKLRATAQKRRLSIQETTVDGHTAFVCVPLRKPSPIPRHIVPWRFEYERNHPALAHCRTAKNHGFEAHINKTWSGYLVTIA